MAQIIKNYTSLEKYEQDVKYNPEGLKPSACKECGCNNIWCNSFYERAVSGRCANRQKADPIAILRFKCSRCKNHYSILPSIVPLLRWYLWCMQQWVLSMVLNGCSMQKAAKEAEVNRKTVSRWYHWLKNKFKIICNILCQSNTNSIQYHDQKNFSSLFCWGQLSHIAEFLHQEDSLVPYSLASNI